MVVRNRRAYHDYHIEDTIEAGLVLTGTEVKSIRAGRISLAGGYVTIDDGEAWLHEVHIAPYEQGSFANAEPLRTRKLLLHRHELDRLARRVRERGYTLVPLSVYFRRGVAKLELGLARGKRAYDKREALREREERRELERVQRERHR